MGAGYFGQSTAPDPRNLDQELGRIGEHSSDITDAERNLGQQFGTDQLGVDENFGKQTMDMYPGLAYDERAATSAQRGGDLGDLNAYGKGITGALNKINPGYQGSLNSLNAAASTAMTPSPLLGELNTAGSKALTEANNLGPSALRTTLTGQAQDALALGGSLSPEEERAAQQSARAAYDSRGLINSGAASAAEVLNRNAAETARLAQRQQFAEGVQQIGQSEDQSNAAQRAQLGQFAQGVQGENLAEQQSGQQFLLNTQQANQNALNPVLGFFGRTDVSPTAGAQVMSSAPNIIGAGVNAMNPILSYGSDIYSSNFNSDAATRISDANNMAAIHGAIIGAVGSIAGGAMKGCWVAREIFGIERTVLNALKWVVFRSWLFAKAPRWFRDLYLAHGERFADWLAVHPLAKAMLRPWFERVVTNETAWRGRRWLS